MAEPLLEIVELRKEFGGVAAVAGVSLRVAPGEVRALIGPNGAGKSTLFNLVAGQLSADGGRVRFRGEEIGGWPAQRIWRRGLSRTFQIPGLFPSLGVLENVQVAALSFAGLSRRMLCGSERPTREAAYGLLRRVGLEEQAERRCGALSAGDLKRLELAAALANRPALLLLDEPTAGMAPPERTALMALVGRIVAEEGVTVLFTEHDMDIVFAAASRITVMHQGRVIAEGEAASIQRDPTVQAVYLGGAV
jgi:branched-chain amino acid transport system ATP-binding protein